MWWKIVKKKKRVPGRELPPPCFGKKGLCPHCSCWFKGAALCTHSGRASAALSKSHWERFPRIGGSQGQEEIVASEVTFWRSHILFAQILRVLSPQLIFSKMKLFHFEGNFPPWYFVSEPTFSTQHFPQTHEVPKSKANLRDAYFVWSFTKESSFLVGTWPPNCSEHCNFQEPQVTWVWRTGCCICHFCNE